MSLSSAIWIGVVVAKLTALAATWRPGLDRGYRGLRWYFILALASDAASYWSLASFGYRSVEYKYAYYVGDLATVVFGFVVLTLLVELAFAQTSLRVPRLRTGAMVLFSGLTVISAASVYLMRGGLTTSTLASELEQNFSFLGMVLAAVLFAGLNLLQVRGVRIRRVVLAFSLLYSSGALVYALIALFPALSSVAYYMLPLTSLLGMGLIATGLLLPEAAPKRRAVAAPAPAIRALGTRWPA